MKKSQSKEVVWLDGWVRNRTFPQETGVRFLCEKLTLFLVKLLKLHYLRTYFNPNHDLLLNLTNSFISKV